MKKPVRIAMVAAYAAFVSLVIAAQSPQPPQSTLPKPSFEVVSVKPSAPNRNIRGGGPRGDRYTMSGVTLRLLVQQAYQKPNNNGPGGQVEIIGGPSWLDSDRFDIEAKADCSGGVLSRGQLALMIQSMLEDRFQLKAHLETRDLPIYNLVVAKEGHKMKASADQTPTPLAAGGAQPCGPVSSAASAPSPPPPPLPLSGGGARGFVMDPAQMPRGAMMVMMGPTGLTLQAAATPIGALIGLLQQAVGRPIIDKTDLNGLYDIALEFSREGLAMTGLGGPATLSQTGPGPAPGGGLAGPLPAPPAPSDNGPSLFAATQDLGLKLESSRGPVEVVVIDSAQKPSEN